MHENLFAQVDMALGEKDQALQWLKKAYAHRAWPLVQLKTVPEWDPLRSDPRLTDLVRRMNFPE